MRSLCIMFITFISLELSGQDLFKGREQLFTLPKAYAVPYTDKVPVIDGIIDNVWNNASWTNNFVDIKGDSLSPKLKTRVKLLWNKEYLFIAAELEEPHIWSYMNTRDTKLFRENCFEVFISTNNSTHNYYEIEINPLNNIFDLRMDKPYRDGGKMDASWNAPGMLHQVHLEGSINNAKDTDKLWTVEMAIPFSALGLTKAPNIGTIWRANFVRVQWGTHNKNENYVKKKDNKGKELPPQYSVWTSHGLVNMHYPERWGYLQFSAQETGKSLDLDELELSYASKQKQYLWLIYYKQKDFFAKTNRYASSLKELDLPSKIIISDIVNTLTLNWEQNLFSASISSNGNTFNINNEGLVY